jgi:hypothetical protein
MRRERIAATVWALHTEFAGHLFDGSEFAPYLVDVPPGGLQGISVEAPTLATTPTQCIK